MSPENKSSVKKVIGRTIASLTLTAAIVIEDSKVNDEVSWNNPDHVLMLDNSTEINLFPAPLEFENLQLSQLSAYGPIEPYYGINLLEEYTKFQQGEKVRQSAVEESAKEEEKVLEKQNTQGNYIDKSPSEIQAAAISGETVWDTIVLCEASGNWNINTGNGYYGGLQMDMTFWSNYGGFEYSRRPDQATREEQIIIAERGLAVQGWGAWPACSAKYGLR